MSGPERSPEARGRRHRRRRAFILVAVAVAFLFVVFLGGIGVAAALSHAADSKTWITWGNVGQTFESINAVFSGLAFAALIVTFWFQLKELREQRLELQLQREATLSSRDQLRRSAQADLRRLHVELLKMSIDDATLAQVWPEIEPGLSQERNRQYLYANLVLQHAWLALELDRYDEESVRTFVRYLFTSPLMRDYWLASRATRSMGTLDQQELAFIELAEQVYREPATGPGE